MKKTMIGLMITMILLTSGCIKTSSGTFDEQEPIALTQRSAEPWLNKEVYAEDILDGEKFDAVRLASVDTSSVTLCVWQQERFKFVNYDYYSANSFAESTLFDYDYFIKIYEIDGTSYAVCADKVDNGLKIVIIDAFVGTKVAELDSLKLPFTTPVGDNIYLSVVEQSGRGLCNKIYSFDGKSLVFTGESYKYSIKQDGKTRGETITAMGAIGTTLYRQISTTKNELLQQGKPEIIVTDINSDTAKAMTCEKPLQFVAGDEKFMFGSVYSTDKPMQSSGFCYDIKDKILYGLQNIKSGGDILCIGKLKDEYLVGSAGQLLILNMQEHSYQRMEKKNMGDFVFCKDNEKLAYTSDSDRGKVITIARRDGVTFSDKIDSGIRKSLKHKLNLPQIEFLLDTQSVLYYLESSTYGNEHNQMANAIAWKYDKATKVAQELKQFRYIFLDLKGVTLENGVLKIPHGIDEVLEINVSQ